MDLQQQDPPAYEQTNPPAYADVLESGPRDQLADNELVCLILNGTSIHSEGEPWRPIFEISSPPAEAKTNMYSVERVRYRLSTNDGDGEMRSHNDHIYDIRRMRGVPRQVTIIGTSGSKHSYKALGMMGARRGKNWLSCEVEEHFKAGQKVKKKVKQHDQIGWEDKEGRLVAIETRAVKQDDTIVEPPKLELKASLEAKELNLLATCWAARVWKESYDEPEDLLGNQKFRRVMASSPQGMWGLYR